MRPIKQVCLVVLALTLTGCVHRPVVVSVPVPTPCPERPAVERPVLEPIPDDAAYDAVAVAARKHLLQMMKYSAELELLRGC